MTKPPIKPNKKTRRLISGIVNAVVRYANEGISSLSPRDISHSLCYENIEDVTESQIKHILTDHLGRIKELVEKRSPVSMFYVERKILIEYLHPKQHRV